MPKKRNTPKKRSTPKKGADDERMSQLGTPNRRLELPATPVRNNMAANVPAASPRGENWGDS